MGDAPGFDVKLSREAATPLRFAGFLLDLEACTLARESGEAITLTRGEFAVPEDVRRQARTGDQPRRSFGRLR